MFKNMNKKVITALFGLGVGIASASAVATCAPLYCIKEYRACVAAGYDKGLCEEQRIWCTDTCER